MRLVIRTIQVLETLAEHQQGVGVVRLAEALGEAPSSVHRLLAVLGEHGYVVKDAGTRRYRLGHSVLRLGQAYQQGNQLAAVASPLLTELSSRTRESVFLSEQTRDMVICVASAESPRPLSFYMRVGQRTPYHAASSARAVLAFQSPDRQEALMRTERMERFTPLTPTTLEAALDALEWTRRHGYALCDQEMEPSITAVSAPIRNSDGSVTASITLVAPQDRLTGDAREDAIEQLLATAAEISARIGYISEVDSARLVAPRVVGASR